MKNKDTLSEEDKKVTVGNYIYELTRVLNTSSSRLDIELLIGKILKCSRENLYTMWERVLTFKELQQIKKLFQQRKKGWPMAYLLEEKEFYGQVFKIKPPVFIPRPDTECLVSSVLSQNNKEEAVIIVDLGSGSGCVGLSLLKHISNSYLVAVDKNTKAVQLGQLNACRLGLENRSVFLKTDVFDLQKQDLELFAGDKILVVANPPYIAMDDPKVQTEVINFESSLALFSGDKGFEYIYSWLKVAQNLLYLDEYYFFEIGDGQSHPFYIGQKINNMYCVNKFKDLSGKTRVIQFKKI